MLFKILLIARGSNKVILKESVSLSGPEDRTFTEKDYLKEVLLFGNKVYELSKQDLLSFIEDNPEILRSK